MQQTSSVVFKDTQSGVPESSVVFRIEDVRKAFLGLEDRFTADPSEIGLFAPRAVVQTGGVTIDSRELDVELDIPFDDDTEANEAEIVVYNLSKTTRENIKTNEKITVTAGYSGDTGVIFSGYISKVQTKHSGADLQTTICAIDDKDLVERDLANVSFAEGSQASYILKSLVERVGLPIAVFQTRYDQIFESSVNVDGGLMQSIKKYAQICGVSAFINKGKIYVIDVTKANIDLHFVVSAETGMIDSPEEFEEEVKEENYTETTKGYKVSMLLQHRMTCGAVCDLSSRDVNGKFYVRKGNHSFNSEEFITEIEMIAR